MRYGWGGVQFAVNDDQMLTQINDVWFLIMIPGEVVVQHPWRKAGLPREAWCLGRSKVEGGAELQTRPWLLGFLASFQNLSVKKNNSAYYSKISILIFETLLVL